MSSQSKLEQEIGELANLPRAELVERWLKIYRCAPPKSVKRGLLERAIAWHAQAKHFGGLSPAIRRQLAEIACGSSGGDIVASQPSDAQDTTSVAPTCSRDLVPTTSLAAGTRLIREWHGRSHSVDVIEEGFVFEGRIYGSLSAIAREITGARWSGPRFFNV